jgi:4'-phosphopantetheinyl transferase
MLCLCGELNGQLAVTRVSSVDGPLEADAAGDKENGAPREPWTDRRSPDRPQFIEGWRKAVRSKVAAAKAAPTTSVAPTGSIDIWIANPNVLTGAGSSLRLLSDEDWEIVHRLQDPARRRATMAARVILRIALSRAVEHKTQPGDWRFVTAPNGRPAVAEGLPPVNFSVSHLDYLVAVAVSVNREVGIDIECIDQNLNPELIAEFTHIDEQHAVGGLPRPQEIREFVRLWTLKEAYTKLVGSGHSLDFKTIKFTLDPINLDSVGDKKTGTTQFENFYISNKHMLFFASLAIRHPPGDLGTTEVQIIGLAAPGGQNGNYAAPLTR